MGSTFNPQILVEKLVKLNSSQQSIETLSHWCIFHMNKARQVVETWARQFHCSPRDQRLPFLYLANDILQNSRRKGSEFVGEFWKVLPGALCDVIDNGDEFGRNAALRLSYFSMYPSYNFATEEFPYLSIHRGAKKVSIWEERKVFGSRGQILKEDIVGRRLETSNKNGKHSGSKLKQSAGNALDKIVSGYQIIYGGQLDEDAVINKCRNTISYVEKMDKEIGGDIRPETNGSGIMEELKVQHATLRDCIEQLTAVESSRANLVSYLREALQEQEMKLNQVRNQLEAAHTQSEKADRWCRQWVNENGRQGMKESQSQSSKVHGEQSGPVTYTRQLPSEEDTKSAAAAVAAKLTASTSSAEMLTHVLSSLASEGQPEKRAKIESQPPLPPFPHPESSHEQQPPPPSSPPPLPPMPPYTVPPFMQTAGTLPYGYTINQQPPLPLSLPLPLSGYSNVNDVVSSYTPSSPPNAYLNYQIYTQPSTMPMTPM